MRQVKISEAIARKYPEWIVLIVTKSAQGQVNVMPAGWSMFTSGIPPMFAVSVRLTHYTHHLIESECDFVIAFPSPGLGPAIEYTGSRHGWDVDKLAGSGLEVSPAKVVKPPLIKGAVANLECKLAASMVTGDHSIFVGQIVAAHVEDEAPERLVNFGAGRYAAALRNERTVFEV